MSSGFGQIFANVALGSVPVNQGSNGLMVGSVLPGLITTSLSSSPTVDPCASSITLPPGSAFAFSFVKNFPRAFKVQGFAGNPPGSADSESGPNPNEAQADSATQFAVTLGGTLPSGVTLYLPTSIESDGGGIAQLVVSEGGSTIPSPPTNTIAATPGTTYFYNVFGANPAGSETYSLSLTTDPVNPESFSGGFSPTLTVNLAPLAADLPGNVPSFQGANGAISFGIDTSSCETN